MQLECKEAELCQITSALNQNEGRDITRTAIDMAVEAEEQNQLATIANQQNQFILEREANAAAVASLELKLNRKDEEIQRVACEMEDRMKEMVAKKEVEMTILRGKITVASMTSLETDALKCKLNEYNQKLNNLEAETSQQLAEKEAAYTELEQKLNTAIEELQVLRDQEEFQAETCKLQKSLDAAQQDRNHAAFELEKVKIEAAENNVKLQLANQHIQELGIKKAAIEDQVRDLTSQLQAQTSCSQSAQTDIIAKMQSLREENTQRQLDISQLELQLVAREGELKAVQQDVTRRVHDLEKEKAFNINDKAKIIALKSRLAKRDKEMKERHDEIERRMDQQTKEREQHVELVTTLKTRLKEKQQELNTISEKMETWKVATAVSLAAELKEKIAMEMQRRRSSHDVLPK